MQRFCRCEDFGCCGPPIHTPHIDTIAARGLRYTGFHTTAMCSTTRAASTQRVAQRHRNNQLFSRLIIIKHYI